MFTNINNQTQNNNTDQSDSNTKPKQTLTIKKPKFLSHINIDKYIFNY